MSGPGRVGLWALWAALLALFGVAACMERQGRWGLCPELPGQNILLYKLMGTWYDYALLQPSGADNIVCSEATSTLVGFESFRIVNRNFDKSKNVTETLIGDGFPDPTEPSRLLIEYKPYFPYMPFWVIATDYETYSITWFCLEIHVYYEPYHFESLKIQTRKRGVMEDGTKKKLYKLLESYGFDTSQFNLVNQTNCYG